MAPNGTHIHGKANYKVYGAIQNIPRHLSHIRYTCQHVHFVSAISCNANGAQTARATIALLSPAEPLKAKHMHVRISL